MLEQERAAAESTAVFSKVRKLERHSLKIIQLVNFGVRNHDFLTPHLCYGLHSFYKLLFTI